MDFCCGEVFCFVALYYYSGLLSHQKHFSCVAISASQLSFSLAAKYPLPMLTVRAHCFLPKPEGCWHGQCLEIIC